jgi:hypothetical protein
MTRTDAIEHAAWISDSHVAVEVVCPRKNTEYYAWTQGEVAAFNVLNRNWDISAHIITA